MPTRSISVISISSSEDEAAPLTEGKQKSERKQKAIDHPASASSFPPPTSNTGHSIGPTKSRAVPSTGHLQPVKPVIPTPPIASMAPPLAQPSRLSARRNRSPRRYMVASNCYPRLKTHRIAPMAPPLAQPSRFSERRNKSPPRHMVASNSSRSTSSTARTLPPTAPAEPSTMPHINIRARQRAERPLRPTQRQAGIEEVLPSDPRPYTVAEVAPPAGAERLVAPVPAAAPSAVVTQARQLEPPPLVRAPRPTMQVEVVISSRPPVLTRRGRRTGLSAPVRQVVASRAPSSIEDEDGTIDS
ncbi:hypothetical protein JR316_0006566 [Psilocybe cubensis]|uniref:Uncharacterized protein n=1 Tax=Psilocybe cubensis TaxID=181762 RepID=A0ACB8H3F9_PSICU|nr:hypothetical protein JR316_0006566 [Psilocybe cubensis]KAH9482036.1 hypothetical protein JR316_0006566 [Psilocybe cubensis]